MSVEPPLHLLGEVRARLAHDDVHGEMGRGLFIEGPQEGEELLVAMPMAELGDRRAIEDGERREQVDGSGAGKSPAVGLPGRSAPSGGPPERVPALAPGASHPPRRPRPSPGDSDRGRPRGPFRLEPGVCAERERLSAVRLNMVILPDAMDRHVTDSELGGQGAGRPVPLPPGLGGQSSVEDPTHQFGREFGPSPRAGSILAEVGDAKERGARPPSADRDGIGMEIDGDPVVGLSLCGPQHDLSAENQSLRDGPAAGPVPEFDPFFGGQHYRGSDAHGGL